MTDNTVYATQPNFFCPSSVSAAHALLICVSASRAGRGGKFSFSNCRKITKILSRTIYAYSPMCLTQKYMGCSDVSEFEDIYGLMSTTPSCVYDPAICLHEQE